MISAYVPCYNNSRTIGGAIRSVLAQTIPVDQTFVVDDGSTDESRDVVAATGVELVEMPGNLGRGAVRARACELAAGDLILSVDATGALNTDFLEWCLPWFEDPMVAAVVGRIDQPPAMSAIDRWRGRHLYRIQTPGEPRISQKLATWGVVLRKSAIESVGNFNRDLRHSEDAELGARLVGGGFRIAYEPRAVVTTMVSNSLPQVLERYWRWNAGIVPRFRLGAYIREIVYSVKVLARSDAKEGDYAAAMISLLSPHYSAMRSLQCRLRG